MKGRIGPTGKYPGGKYTQEDEGAIGVGIAADPRNRKVVIQFGKPVAWLGLDPEHAETLAQSLLEKAREARGEPL